MGHYAKPVTDRPVEERFANRANHYFSGRDGGKDIDLRQFGLKGITLHGPLSDVTGGRLSFADDLVADLDAAEAVYNGINQAVDAYFAQQGLGVADGPPVYELYGYRRRIPIRASTSTRWLQSSGRRVFAATTARVLAARHRWDYVEARQETFYRWSLRTSGRRRDR